MMLYLAYLGSPAQWLLLALVCLLVVGTKRLPKLARHLGRMFGEFSKARREFEDSLHETIEKDKQENRDEK